ncbi:MAG: hypothetical protein M3345_01680 [Actinomycetota bacterium]|nr:hypothetical protein [Actinomycetota bacterium]
MALIEGRYPPGMTVRCSRCSEVRPVEEGGFLSVKLTGAGMTQVFCCSDCRKHVAA